MSAKKARAARQAARASVPPAAAKSGRRSAELWRSRPAILVGFGILVVLALSFVIPSLTGSSNVSEAAHAKQMGVGVGEGVTAGSAVPSFTGRDVISGRTISSKSVYGQKTLLFFSEGVMCQACLEQISGIQQMGAALARRGIHLVSLTPDSVGELQHAAADYGISTPLIADSNRSISTAFNTLGLGMHSNTPGHAFALIYRGKVLWYRDYYRPPYSTMYVRPSKLLAAIPRA
jgi:peroxiredoxin